MGDTYSGSFYPEDLKIIDSFNTKQNKHTKTKINNNNNKTKNNKKQKKQKTNKKKQKNKKMHNKTKSVFCITIQFF